MKSANALLFISVIAGALAVLAAAEQRAEARNVLEPPRETGPTGARGDDDAASARWVALWQARAATLSLWLALFGLALLGVASYLHARG